MYCPPPYFREGCREGNANIYILSFFTNTMPQRDYIFYELTKSVCHHCRKLCDAKIIFRDNNVYMLKQCLKQRCRTRTDNLVLVATDIEYYKSQKDYYKP